MKSFLKLKGMTLTELLVVLAILGILMLLAFPVLKPLFGRVYSLEAQTNLKYIAELQDTYYLSHIRYSDQFNQLGFEQAKLRTDEDGNANYKIEIVEVSETNFLARATAISDFDGDGIYNVWEIDKKGVPHEVEAD